MFILPSILLAALGVFVDKAAASPAISDPHQYFMNQIHQAVEAADSYSPKATPYPARYPTIDISPWVYPASSTDDQRQEVVYQVLAQALGAGSFNIIGHGLSSEQLDRLENSTARFFSESLDFKRQFSGKPGYTANQQEKYGSGVYHTDDEFEMKGDLREIYATGYKTPDNIPGPAYFQSELDAFMEHMQPVESGLNAIVAAALSIAKGVDLPPTYMSDADGDAPGWLRAHRYPAMPSEYDEATRFLPHSDFSTLTIIYGTEKGLEEIRDGRWIEVPIEKGVELHVTVGEVLAMWSNGLLSNNIHRVSAAAAKDRISFAYFFSQGNVFSGQPPAEGTEPVLSATNAEVPRFPATNTAIHIAKYAEAKGTSM